MRRVAKRRRRNPVTKGFGRSTKDVGRGFADLYASPSLVALLAVILEHPTRPHHQRELVRLAGGRLYSVQRELARLERAGLITRHRRGNQVIYRPNRSHPAFADLRSAFRKTVGLAHVLAARLAPLRGRLTLAFVHGSVAQGRDAPDSDVDIVIVGDVSLRVVSTVLCRASRQLGREINPVVYPRAEFVRRLRAGEHFIKAIARESKIWLVGNDDELARMAP